MSSVAIHTNVYDSRKSGSYVINRTFSVVFISSMLVLCGISPSGSAQVLPETDLECDDSTEIDLSNGAGTSVINCELTNPTTFAEKVELTYQGGALDTAGPGSVTVGGGQTSSFQIVIASSSGQSAGTYEVGEAPVARTSIPHRNQPGATARARRASGQRTISRKHALVRTSIPQTSRVESA